MTQLNLVIITYLVILLILLISLIRKLWIIINENLQKIWEIERIFFIYLLKKNPKFDESLYPPIFCGEHALTLDEWMYGSNKEPLKKDIRQIENKYVTQS